MLRRFASVLLVVAAGLAPGFAEACPNCKEAVAAQPGEAAGMQNGFNYSILLMLTVPFAIVSTGAFAVGRAVRRGAMPEL